MTKLLEKLFWNKLVQHSLFWTLSFVVLLNMFAYSDDLAAVDFIYTFLFHLSLIIVVYLNIRLWIPIFLQRRSYLLYVIALSLTASIGVLFNNFTFNYLADIVFPGYYFIESYGFYDILKFVVVYLALSSLLKFSKSWFKQIETEQKLDKLAKEKQGAEMGALKSQINPHFLFNNLNNLYSLSLDNDKRAPGFILRISEMMRYLLYETNSNSVLLEKEIDHLDNFINLQKLKVEDQLEVKFEVIGNLDNIKVAPLLFLPLVENAFKHGVKVDHDIAFVKILMEVSEDIIAFNVENNKGEIDEMFKNENSGFGLDNLRKRLELSYPSKHQLKVMDGVNRFTVFMKLELS